MYPMRPHMVRKPAEATDETPSASGADLLRNTPVPPPDPIMAERLAAEKEWRGVDFVSSPEFKALLSVADAAEQVLYGGESMEVLREAYDRWEERFKKAR